MAPFWTFEWTKVCTTHKPNAVGTLCDRDNTTLCERSNESARGRCERMKRVECEWRQETQRVNKNHFICCARCSMPAYVCSCVCACLSSGGSCACRCSVCERERYQPQRLALKQTLPIQFETRYRLGICACVFHCFPPIWFIFIIIFLFFSEIKNIFNLWKRKRTSFWLFTPYIHLIFVSNVNEWRVFIKFKNWLLEFHIIASRLYSKSTNFFSLHEIRGKKSQLRCEL